MKVGDLVTYKTLWGWWQSDVVGVIVQKIPDADGDMLVVNWSAEHILNPMTCHEWALEVISESR